MNCFMLAIKLLFTDCVLLEVLVILVTLPRVSHNALPMNFLFGKCSP